MKALALVFLIAAPNAHATEDYALPSMEWNGLGTLMGEVEQAGCPVSAPSVLDWAELGPHDVLWLIYPETSVDGARLKRHLARGGRVLVADDFGAAGGALEALEIRRSQRTLPLAVPRYRDNPNLPIAHPGLGTELGRATSDLVANHPAELESALPATYAFSDGAALVVEGQVGTGWFVALSDPSVLINNMLELDGNRAFAQALARRMCKPGDRVLVLSHHFTVRGEPGAEGSTIERANRALTQANGDLTHDLASTHVLLAAAVVLAVASLLVFFGGFPARGQVDQHWNRLTTLLERPEPMALTAWDHALAAGVVRDEAVERVGAALGVTVQNMGPSELGRRVEALAGVEAGRQAAELWRELHRLGWRPGERPLEPISARRFRRMHQLASAVFAALDYNRSL